MQGRHVRIRILADHDDLRRLLEELEPLAEACDRGAPDDRSLRNLGRDLYARFATHLDLENRLLMPLLHASGASARAKRLADEHREQRTLLEYLLDQLDQQGRPTVLVAREMLRFAEYLREEMTEEENQLLHEEILRPGATFDPALTPSEGGLAPSRAKTTDPRT